MQSIKKGSCHYTRAQLTRMRHLKRSYVRRHQTQFGILVPSNVRNALILDKENKNNKWEESVKRETGGIIEHKDLPISTPWK
jgi:hypothetical protein